uniref:C-type lectin domain-containing protein n=1 Tax=Ciona savignyi TaxID=51511 RepID=H2ZM64_CIOSA
MKNHVFAESVPEVGCLYLDVTGLHFDYAENARNDIRNAVDEARMWWRWVDEPATTRFADLDDACTLGSSGLPDFLEIANNDIITVRGARHRRRKNRFIAQNKFATCDRGWFLFRKKCYRIFRYLVTRKARALNICSYFKGTLTVPRTKKEHSFLRKFITHFDEGGEYWLGMQARERGARFYDIDGTALRFRKWARRQTTFDSDKCSYFASSKWYKTNCNSQHKVLCAKPAQTRTVANCGRIQIPSVDDIMRIAAGGTENEGRIVNGVEALEGQFPWQVSIRFREP